MSKARPGYVQNKITGSWVPIEYVIQEACDLMASEFDRLAEHIGSIEWRQHLKALAQNSRDTNNLVQNYIQELKDKLEAPTKLPPITSGSNNNGFMN